MAPSIRLMSNLSHCLPPVSLPSCGRPVALMKKVSPEKTSVKRNWWPATRSAAVIVPLRSGRSNSPLIVICKGPDAGVVIVAVAAMR